MKCAFIFVVIITVFVLSSEGKWGWGQRNDRRNGRRDYQWCRKSINKVAAEIHCLRQRLSDCQVIRKLTTQCDSKHYGPKCIKPCSRRHCDESLGKSTCDRKRGLCVDGCLAGWTGPDCTEECDSKHYGFMCEKLCSERHCDESLGKSCEKETGLCVDGCAAGWKGPDCTEECDSKHYGPKCVKSCSKRHCDESLGKSSCDRRHGLCVDGCFGAWKGQDCTLSKTVD
ncbi:platelet endothelial aggregation receptor 1-like isoform X2 [Gigantopelta aegis]|uniref:platelet endothelial aggregation receptor 1-like isoform X2 n=1 Tax=Gigantopelta aegis TaxID=1735272 RepID=UPI001B88C132|nr:platelet endothelial aggregation receptor 1-like isoform X2 [Gigantopelta aegis]